MQGLALMESNQGNYRAAQQLFQQGSENCPPHAPLFNAWASMEVSHCPAVELYVKFRNCVSCVNSHEPLPAARYQHILLLPFAS